MNTQSTIRSITQTTIVGSLKEWEIITEKKSARKWTHRWKHFQLNASSAQRLYSLLAESLIRNVILHLSDHLLELMCTFSIQCTPLKRGGEGVTDSHLSHITEATICCSIRWANFTSHQLFPPGFYYSQRYFEVINHLVQILKQIINLLEEVQYCRNS